MRKTVSAIRNLRSDYAYPELRKENIKQDPLRQFELWMQDALNKKIPEPNAMNFATCSKDCKPSSRVVLLRGISNNGFEFFTNYLSRKGKEIEDNPWGALTFYWSELSRQVRIEGKLKKIPAEQSNRYFSTRPRDSQVGAWASHQSEIIENREELESWFSFYKEKFKGKKVKRPEHWGGYLLIPDSIEFWQGRPNRLHDRLTYQKLKNGKWKISRLSP